MSKLIILAYVCGIAIAQPVYCTGAHLIQVDVVVRTDKAAVKGLTKDDFTVQDKGKSQTISVFAVTEKPAAAANATPLPPGVVSNRIASGGEGLQTATIVLFDRLNTQDPAAQATARREILALLRSLKPGDKIGFYSLFDSITVVQEFGEPADALSQAAGRLSAQPSGASNAPANPLDAVLRDSLNPAQPLDKPTRMQITAGAFRSIARRLGGIAGRKNLIWLTSGAPVTYGTSTERRANDEAEINGYARILSDANIALYPIDPRGAGSSFTEATTDKPTEGSRLGGATNQLTQSADTLTGAQGLQIMADATGGKAYLNANDVSVPLREILDFAEPTYTLGFYVDEKAFDGKNHDLNIKVASKPETKGAKAYFRKSYIAANPPLRPSIQDLSAEKLDATSVGVMAVAVRDPSKPGVHVVQVRVSASDLQFEHRADKWVASFDLGLSIENAGKPGTVNVKTMNLSLTDDQLKQAVAGGVDIDNTVPSPDQPSKLRVVVQDKASGVAGSVRIPIAKN